MIGLLCIFHLFISLFICVLGLYYSWQSVAYTSPNNAEILKAIAKGVCVGVGLGVGLGGKET